MRNEFGFSSLRKGSRGDDVAALQKRLGIKADGIFGPRTEAALRDFQRIKGLAPDGIFGPKTHSALFGASNAAPQTYVVKPGDTLSAIAKHFGTTADAFGQANPHLYQRHGNKLSGLDYIRAGEKLNIPGAQSNVIKRPHNATGAPGAGAPTYIVRHGDTLSKIAKRMGTTVAELGRNNPFLFNRHGNKLSGLNYILPGDQLAVPGSQRSAVTDRHSTNIPSGGILTGGNQTYDVKPGDTLSGIAKRFGTTPEAFGHANPNLYNRQGHKLSGLNYILPGDNLTLPDSRIGTTKSKAHFIGKTRYRSLDILTRNGTQTVSTGFFDASQHGRDNFLLRDTPAAGPKPQNENLANAYDVAERLQMGAELTGGSDKQIEIFGQAKTFYGKLNQLYFYQYERNSFQLDVRPMPVRPSVGASEENWKWDKYVFSNRKPWVTFKDKNEYSGGFCLGSARNAALRYLFGTDLPTYPSILAFYKRGIDANYYSDPEEAAKLFAERFHSHKHERRRLEEFNRTLEKRYGLVNVEVRDATRKEAERALALGASVVAGDSDHWVELQRSPLGELWVVDSYRKPHEKKNFSPIRHVKDLDDPNVVVEYGKPKRFEIIVDKTTGQVITPNLAAKYRLNIPNLRHGIR